MKESFFQKRSIGLAPLASLRDWTILLVVVAGVLALREAAARWSLMDSDDLRVTFIGTCIGMLPSVLMCLPVHGVVDDLSRDALGAFLGAAKFNRHIERNGTRFYTQNTPSWMRWDSNRVTVKPLADGHLRVSMPLYVYRLLKRWR